MLTDLSKEQQLMILGLVVLLLAGFGVMTYRRGANDSSSITISNPTSEVEARVSVVVHVTGAVAREGVYKLESGDRVIDALNLAGGATGLAELSSLNLAEKLKDGERIVVATKSLPVIGGSGDTGLGDQVIRGLGTGNGTAKINLNTASEEQLQKIPGVGPSTAKRILEYRKTKGSFSKIEDLMRVKGIGKGKFGKIKEFILI